MDEKGFEPSASSLRINRANLTASDRTGHPLTGVHSPGYSTKYDTKIGSFTVAGTEPSCPAYGAAGLVSLLTVVCGVAQSPSRAEKPVWTVEFIKVKPGMFGLALGYLDDDWMRVLEEAKHQGAILDYHRIAEQGRAQSDGNIALLT